MNPSQDERRVLILGPNPTPNGGMHLGHIAGPYLAGDIYARYQRARGRDVIFTTGTDDSQTYVQATAAREGITPEELCVRSTGLIRDALAAIGISVDGFGPFDDTYQATVLKFFSELHAAGVFRLKKVRLPFLERTGEFVVEGLIEGECPVCLATSRGGLCETCCHPNNYDELVDAHSTIDQTEKPTVREAEILVFPLEEYRERLTAFHEARIPSWRPHLGQMIREVLARPLPDIPITYPLGWGMAAPFPETPGQVLNAWLELMPAGMYTTSYAAAQLGTRTEPGQLWQREEDLRVVHFLGFDNAFFFCLPHIALLMAHGEKYVLPEWIINNEFYELESAKFSTSKGHVVSVQDLLREVPRDVARLYLALTAPEHGRTTFSRVGLDKIAEERLAGPWNRLAATLGKAVANARDAQAPLPVSATARGRVTAMLARFDTTYEMPGYSLSRSAETVLVHIGRLAGRADALAGQRVEAAPEAWGDLFFEVRALLAAASPILIDLAEAAGLTTAPLAAGGFDLTEITPFAPPEVR
ncbi:class I tRNA ligase family protein [Actinocrispum wychmicini]|uniref:Methionyl-tRNA synthetase n=1 Tax=Actinocrispum wychmicini TaxID=1213861 RepID=A0A4R2J8M1_9PSEU|nr:class I tRNA ligase family protein [Actinocrispum wychmicini]TCO54082.1 methionyl-tRNA synthetase [Actinocrispum wychmicini]